MGRILYGSPPSAFMDRVSMGIPHLRGVTSHTIDAVQAQCVPFESVEDDLESSLGHDPELRIPGVVCCFIPM